MPLQSQIIARVLLGIGATAESIGQLLAGTQPDGHAAGEDAPGVQGRAFEHKLAKEVEVGEILAVDGRAIEVAPGRRALRVTRKLPPEPSMFGNETITFMTVDVDTDEPHSFRAPKEFPLLVAVDLTVPDSVPSDTGEQSTGG